MKYLLLNLPNPPYRNACRGTAGGFGTTGIILSLHPYQYGLRSIKVKLNDIVMIFRSFGSKSGAQRL